MEESIQERESQSPHRQFTRTSVAAIANNMIQSHNYCRSILTELGDILKVPHKQLSELIDNSSKSIIVTLKGLPSSLRLEDIVSNEEEMPLDLYTMERLLHDDSRAAYSRVVKFATQESIRALQGLRSPTGKSLYDICTTLHMMKQPVEFQHLDTSDFRLYDQDHSIRDSLERGANCIDRLLKELKSIIQHSRDELDPFLARPERHLTAEELEQWDDPPEDTEALQLQHQTFWVVVASTGDRRHEDFDQKRHREAIEKFITFFLTQPIERASEIEEELERYCDKLAAWRDGLPEEARLERVG